HPALCGGTHHVDRGARSLGGARPRRHHDGVEPGDHGAGAGWAIPDLVGLDHLDVSAQLAQIPDEGVHEAVSVVDDEHAGHPTVTSCGFTNWLTQGKTYQNRL